MTTSSVTQSCGAAAMQTQRAPRGERPPEFQDLFDALQDGDLDKAKEALGNIKTPPGADSSKDPLADVRKAVESGDVSASQEAFTSFETEMKNHRPPHGGPPPQRKSGVENDLQALLNDSTISLLA